MMFDEQIIKTAAYVGRAIYSTAYTSTAGSFLRANFYYKCADGTIIHRPNHNIANALRRFIYLKPVMDYYAINGNEAIKEQLAILNTDELEKISYILLFYTSGRKNELNISEIYKKAVFQNLETYFDSCGSLNPFRDIEDLQHYASLLLSESNKPRGDKDKAIALLLKSCHELDLLRCFPNYKLQKSLFNTFNENSQQKNTRNLQSLVFYAQNCIIAMGDKLRTRYQFQDIHGSYHRQGFHLHLRPSRVKPIKTGNNSVVLGAKGYDEAQFKVSTRVDEEGITQTLQNLEQVPKPIFFKHVGQDGSYTTEKALALIREGNAAVRIIDGSPNDISLRFELEQLVNPNFMRPLRKKKLKKPHTTYTDLKTQQTVTRKEKDYIELPQQFPIKSPKDLPIYQSDKFVSRQGDRGKPKKTIFSKKQSYSLLPRDGIFSLFKGRLEYRINSSFIPVGTLYDLKKMHHKEERYIWSDDVRSSGINGYFWLTDKSIPTQASSSTVRYNPLSISELKTRLQDKSNAKMNEMLLGASLDSLQALFARKDDRLHRLAVLHASAVLSHDYGVTRPLLIVTGKSSPTAYTREQIQTDLTQAIKKYRQWYWRLLHLFISSKEQQLLLALIAPISADGLKVAKHELIAHYSRVNESEITIPIAPPSPPAVQCRSSGSRVLKRSLSAPAFFSKNESMKTAEGENPTNAKAPFLPIRIK